MIVERNALRAAIVHVYRLLLKQKPPCLSAAELERRWAKAGIRRADLEVAMREMQHRHLIIKTDTGPDAIYRLTAHGIDAYPALRGSLATRLTDALTLLRIRARLVLSNHQVSAGRRRWRDRMVEPQLPVN